MRAPKAIPGVARLSTRIKALEATNPNTVVVAAGDIIGATPLMSALFHDEPTIESMNLLGLDVAAVGNHEFDEGAAELLRMQNGGCHPVDGCQDGTGFEGAQFKYLAANVTHASTGETIFPSFTVKRFGGAKVGFIGLTLEGTPLVTTATGVAGLEFSDEADTINALVPVLKGLGVETIVVLIHEGGAATGKYNECTGISGALFNIVSALDPEVDAVVAGHTHAAYTCIIDGKHGRLVTSGDKFGTLVTAIDLTLDRASRDITSTKAENIIVRTETPGERPAADCADRALSEDRAADGGSGGGPSGGSAHQGGDARRRDHAGRRDRRCAAGRYQGRARQRRRDRLHQPRRRADRPALQGRRRGDLCRPVRRPAVRQFAGDHGADRTPDRAHAGGQQWVDQPKPRILHVSDGFSYRWDGSKPPGERVDPASLQLNGVPIDPEAAYRVTVNNFLADGGDGFGVLVQGTDRLGGAVDLDAFEAYLLANPGGVAPGPQNRIVKND